MFGLIIITFIMLVDKAVSMYLPRWNWVHSLRVKDTVLRDISRQYPGYFAVAAWFTTHKVGRDYTQAARMQGKAYSSDVTGDGPSCPDEVWRAIMHWELMIAVKEREDRYLKPRHEAATKLAAFWRGRVEYQWLHDGPLDDALFTWEYGNYDPDDHAAAVEEFGWFYANCCRYWHRAGADRWMQSDEDMDDEVSLGSLNSESSPHGVAVLGDWFPIEHQVFFGDVDLSDTSMMGAEYSSDEIGDGPPSAHVQETLGISPLDVFMDEDAMEILLFRFEKIVEMFDLQVWSFSMRTHEHEYQGQPFNHHEEFGSSALYSRLHRFGVALLNHFQTGGGDCVIPLENWMDVTTDLEILERSDIFQDEVPQKLLQSMISDFILFYTLPDHRFTHQSDDWIYHVPLF